MRALLLAGVFLALLAVLLYAAFGSGMSVDKAELSALCVAEVKAAQESSLGKVCTQEVRALYCPHDASFTYEASNGCELSFLESLGWR